MTFKKLFGKLHLWLGLISGLVVFIISITGCLWVFQDELRPLFYADRLYIEVPTMAERAPMTVLLHRAEQALGSHYRLERVYYPTAPDETVYIQFRNYLDEEEHKLGLWYGKYMEYFYRVYLNPYTGEVVHIENTKWEFFNVVLWLHFSLLLKYSIGHTIVGYAVLVFVVMLITGLVLWWPKNKSAAKQRFWFRWNSATRWKRKNYDLHNIAGFYGLAVALLISVTGLVWAFKWVDQSVQWLANGGETLVHEEAEYQIIPSDGPDPLDPIIKQMFINHREAQYFYLQFPKKDKSPLNLTAIFNENGFDDYVSYSFDPYTGKLLEEERFSDLNNGEKVRALNYYIHIGSILGFPGKVIAFCASLISASLPVTGVFIWWGRRKKENNRQKQKNKKVLPPKTMTFTH